MAGLLSSERSTNAAKERQRACGQACPECISRRRETAAVTAEPALRTRRLHRPFHSQPHGFAVRGGACAGRINQRGTARETTSQRRRGAKNRSGGRRRLATERYGIQALGEELARSFELEHVFIDSDNPV